MSFDYGNKRSDGQFEHHPMDREGEFVAPIRNSTIHDKCGVKTIMGRGIAETYAKHPEYYGSHFCAGCHDYFPVSEFYWAVDGVRMGELGGEPGEDLCEGRRGYI